MIGDLVRTVPYLHWVKYCDDWLDPVLEGGDKVAAGMNRVATFVFYSYNSLKYKLQKKIVFINSHKYL